MVRKLTISISRKVYSDCSFFFNFGTGLTKIIKTKHINKESLFQNVWLHY